MKKVVNDLKIGVFLGKVERRPKSPLHFIWNLSSWLLTNFLVVIEFLVVVASELGLGTYSEAQI